jgi:hypothetical protein
MPFDRRSDTTIACVVTGSPADGATFVDDASQRSGSIDRPSG